MRATTKRLTADDVWKLHTETDAYGWELVDGELVEMSPASPRHGRIWGAVYAAMNDHVRQERGGVLYIDSGFVLRVPGDPERLRFPDIAYVSDDTLAEGGGEPETGYARFAPELAVEIDSPPNRQEDVQQKVQDYLDGGVRLVWVVHPANRAATVYRPDGSARLLREGEALEGEDVLPGLRIPLEKLLD